MSLPEPHTGNVLGVKDVGEVSGGVAPSAPRSLTLQDLWGNSAGLPGLRSQTETRW